MDKNKIAVDIFDKLADLYQSKFMDVSLYHDTFDLFCRYVNQEKAAILELACGPGNITQYLLSQRPDFRILATDLAPQMLDLARKNNPSAELQVLDCRDIGELTMPYNGLMCGFCLPYLSKEEAVQLIANASQLLVDGGVLYLSTMEDDYANSGWRTGSTGDKMYQYFHEEAYLNDALTKNGFEILNVIRKKSPGPDDTVVVDLVIIAKASDAK